MKYTTDFATLSIDAALAARALPFRPQNDVRYYLNGLYVEPEPSGGANVIATDGHAMICLHDPEGSAARPMILPIGKGQATLLRKKGKLHADADGRAYITDEHGQCIWISPTTHIEGKYPNTKTLLGNPDEYVPGIVGGVNPELLARIQSARATSTRWGRPVRFFHKPASGLKSGILATLGEEGFAYLMPMSIKEDEILPRDCVPASFFSLPQTEAQAA